MEPSTSLPEKSNEVFEAWVKKPVPEIPEAQLAKFTTPESIDVHEIGEFSPSALVETLKNKTGSKVLGIDLGGGSVRCGVYVAKDDGSLALTEDYSEKTATENGEGFLSQLKAFAEYARTNNIPVGMSYGGPLDGSKPRYHPKIPKLMDELSAKYAGDFANIFSTPFSILNDGPAGVVRSVDFVFRSGIENPTVFYLINGGGLGLAVYKDGNMYSTESGHIECVDELNFAEASRPCGLYGDHVCLENVISNKQGLERQWFAKTSEALNGKQIEDKFRAGDQFAYQLFEQTARVQAAMIKGSAQVFESDINSPDFAVVVHGGVQRTPNLRRRTAQILWQDLETKKELPFTEEFDPNACMHGAALRALSS